MVDSNANQRMAIGCGFAPRPMPVIQLRQSFPIAAPILGGRRWYRIAAAVSPASLAACDHPVPDPAVPTDAIALMSLLKSLEAEAERLRLQKAAEAEQLGERRQQYVQSLQPALRALQTYLERVCAGLSELNAESLLEHAVAGYGTLVARIEHRYSVRLEERVRATELILEAEAEILGPRCPEVAAEGTTRVRALMDLFQQAGVTAFRNGRRDARGQWVQATFKPRGKLPLRLSLLAEPGATDLRLTLAGFEGLAILRKNIPPEQLDEALFDRIGRYVARRDNELTREQLPDKVRHSLKQKVHQEALRRRWEDQLHYQRLREEEALQRALEEQKLANRARRLLQDWQGRLLAHPRMARLLSRLRRQHRDD